MKILVVIAILTIASVLLLAIKAFLERRGKSVQAKNVEELEPANIIGRGKIKLMPYKEALEASKQFIYNMAKVVLERFSPSTKSNLLELGKKLLNADVQYVHVVDMFTLSLYKQIAKRKMMSQQKNEKIKGRSA